MTTETDIIQQHVEIVKSIGETIKHPIDEAVNIVTSANPFEQLCAKFLEGISWLLKYEVFTTANDKPVLVITLLAIVILLFIGFAVAKRVSLSVKRRVINSPDLDISVATALERVSHYSLSLIIVLFVLNMFNIPLTTFAVIGTTLAFALGLGSQHIANNFLSGVVLLLERPIKLEEKIEVNGITGRVLNMGTRCTSILTEDNCCVFVPNSAFLQEVVVNRTNEHTKAVLNTQIKSDIKIEDLDKRIMEAVSSLPRVLKYPAAKILYRKITQDFYDLNIEFYINCAMDYRNEFAINDLNRALSDLLQKHAIAVAPSELIEPEEKTILTVPHKLVSEESAAEKFI